MTEYTIQSGCISWVIRVLSDVNTPPDPTAWSDWDFWGDRETEWEVVRAGMYIKGEFDQLTEEEINAMLTPQTASWIHKQVQHMIDIDFFMKNYDGEHYELQTA